MDDDGSGVVSLEELDPDAHELIESFYSYIDLKSERVGSTAGCAADSRAVFA